MLTKTDNRSVLTTYQYDSLNRLYSKTYSDGTPAVTYTYDPTGSYGVGHLGSVSNANSTTNYLTFDKLGRVTSSNQVTGGTTYTFSYGYNFASDLTSETYPSGRVVSFTYDNANRLNGASGQMGAQASVYASSFVYAAFGQPTNYQYGNGLVRVLNYNSRLQIQSYTDQGYNSTTNTATPRLSATLNWYDANGHNNGNLQGVSYTHSGSGFSTPLSFSDTFTYDNVNRLLSATDVLVATGATEWLQNYGFDQYGNMSVLSSTGITPPGNTPGLYTSFSNNQIVGGAYDLGGNQTLVNGNKLTYDAEGREVKNVSNGTETYAYDGDGKRVGKSSQTGSTTFVYDALGQLAMEVSSVATVPACVTCYLTDDHLGSTRLVTDGSGNVVARHDYLPFGYEIQASDNVGRGIQFGGYDNINQKFTSKERDSESGLDYFGARYYGSALGRFTSPDWSASPQAVPYADINKPQSLNLYAYVQNNPLKNRDLDGHICVFGIGNTCTQPAPASPRPPAAPTNPVYGTVDEAGVAAAKADKSQTDASRAKGNPVEYGNSVHTVAGVAYSYTDPVTSNKRDTVNPNTTTGLDSAPIPAGATQVGEAHSHSDIAVDADGNRAAPRDQLSFQDRNRTLNYPDYQKQFQASYVALPDGTIIKYDIHNQTTVIK